MNRITCIVIIIILFTSLVWSQQSGKTTKWEQVKFLVGEWTGEGGGQPGVAAGGSSFTSDLDDHIIVRKNFAEYPAKNGRPAFRHEDLMIIYSNPDGTVKAVYFDNENHVINYDVDIPDDGSSIVFLSESAEGMPLFRMTYNIVSEDKVTLSFEIAPSGKINDLSKYIESSMVRSK
ncbi:MAG: hypothetical protein A2V66_01515 [Ignavibacteria bacterium RBG_13_36_8]|nr:MAG: hypothetical protein A2V66_01515 [Ignavibacteria bacterium RBG_13_36_8]